MKPYIGTPTSRVDGYLKVTGTAQYAGEFHAADLAYGSVVSSTVAKGRITRIDASRALAVEGVIDVLTHENRPKMGDTDEAYNDEVAPGGSPFRPLYDDRIKFNGQPIALVVAETAEIAQFAASLVWVEYDKESHVTDVYRQRDAAVPTKASTDPIEAMFTPPKARGTPDQALAAAAVRHEAEYRVPIEHHNPMELFASTVIFEGDGKLTVYDKTQGVQNVQMYLCRVFGMKPEDVRVMSPFMGGGFGSGLRPQFQVVLAVLAARALQRSVRVVLTRQQMYALGYRPAMIQRIAIGANTGGTLDVITHDAVTVTSQYEDFHRQETGWSGLLYKSANAKYAHSLVRLDLPTSCDMRAPSAATALFALESAMDELAVALKLDPLELRLRCYSDRDQHEDKPYSSKALRECYRQGAEAFGWDKRNPEPRSMRDGSDLVGWGMATGVWEALQASDHGAHRAHRQRPCRGGVRDLRHRHRHLHHHGAGCGRHARAAARQHQHQARRLEPSAIAGRRRIVDRNARCRTGSQPQPAQSATSCCDWPSRCRTRRSPTPRLTRLCSRTASL